MNKKNRKGFTIVELVIVIAVIGILATVLVPTFGDVIKNANESADLQKAKAIYTNYVAKHVDETEETFDTQNVAVKVGTKYFEVTNGVMAKTSKDSTSIATVVELDGGLCKADCKH